MKQERYIVLNRFMHGHPRAASVVSLIGKTVTVAVYLIYPLFLLTLFLRRDDRLLSSVLVPLISFVTVSVLRRAINLKRPYEVDEIEPICNRRKSGCSFPSRHTFSAFIIAFTVCGVYPWLGGVLIACAAILAVTRVLCGVHYIRDVAAGTLFAIIAAVLGALIR